MIWKLLKRLGIHPMFRTRGKVSAVRLGAKTAEGDARYWLSWQGLNECECGRELSLISHGRAWLHFADNCFGWSWVLGKWMCGAELVVDAYGGEHDLSGDISLPLFQFYWHIDRVWPQRYRPQIGAWWKRVCGYDSRVTGVSVHHGAIFGKLWAPENGWDSKQPKWMDWSFDLADFFLGRHSFSETVLSVVNGDLHLPEGDYPARVTLSECVWKRPRWPFVKRRRSANIEPERPIPIPGKGENSWDCGDDAIYSMSVTAETAEEAGTKMVARVQEQRERHGGKDWQPVAMEAAA